MSLGAPKTGLPPSPGATVFSLSSLILGSWLTSENKLKLLAYSQQAHFYHIRCMLMRWFWGSTKEELVAREPSLVGGWSFQSLVLISGGRDWTLKFVSHASRNRASVIAEWRGSESFQAGEPNHRHHAGPRAPWCCLEPRHVYLSSSSWLVSSNILCNWSSHLSKWVFLSSVSYSSKSANPKDRDVGTSDLQHK